MTAPYNQDAETPESDDYEAWIAELQAEVEELRVGLMHESEAREHAEARAEARGKLANEWRDLYYVAQARIGDHGSRPRHSIVSKLLWLVWLAVVVIATFYVCAATSPHENAVCHSPTEDSTITDCDYRDGGWYPEDG